MADRKFIDIRDIRGTKTTKPTGASRLSRETNRIHQAARSDDQDPRGQASESAAEPPECGGRVSDAAVQKLAARAHTAGKR